MIPPDALAASPALALVIVLGLMASLLAGVRVFQIIARPHPEIARKMFHAGGGIVAAALPWLTDRTWPVMAIGLGSATAFLLLRVVPRLRGSLGQVLGGVGRASEGEFFFLASVVVLFLLSGRRPALYVAPVLVLALADTAAALIGVGYGKVRFRTVEGRLKSVEGSLAFLIAAFLCVHVPLLVWTSVGRIESLLIAANVAVLAMMAEAVAWRGLDNFFVPFIGYAFLRGYLAMPAWRLGMHTGVIVGLFVFAYLWRGRTNLAANARITGVLFVYTAWTLASWVWLVPPLMLLSTYRALSRRVPLDGIRHINLFVVAALLLPSLGWVVMHWLRPLPGLFLGFATMFAAHLALIAFVRDAHVMPQRPWISLLPAALVRGAVLLVPSLFAAEGLTRAAAIQAVVGLGAVVTAAATFALVQPQLNRYPLDVHRWARQAMCVSAASLGAWGLFWAVR